MINSLLSIQTASFLVLFLLSGCNFGSDVIEIDDAESSGSKTITVNIEELKPVRMSQFFSDVRYVPLETPEEGSLIMNLDKMIVQDGRVFIMFGGDIYIFEESGEIVAEFQIPRGVATGQLIEPSDFVVHPGTDQFSVYGRKRVNRYTFEGHIVDEFFLNVPAAGLGVTPEGNYVFNINNRQVEDSDYVNSDHNLIFMDMERQIYQKALEIEEQFVNTRFPIATNFTAYRDTLLYYAHPDNNIYEIIGDDVAVRYHVDFGEHGIPKEMFDNRPNYNIDNSFNEYVLNRGYSAFLDMVHETDHTVFFSFMNSTEVPSYWVFYDKSSGTTHVADELVNDIDHGIGPYFLAASGNDLIGALHPGDIIDVATLIRDELSDEELEAYLQQEGNLIDLAETLTVESNPVLMFARTK